MRFVNFINEANRLVYEVDEQSYYWYGDILCLSTFEEHTRKLIAISCLYHYEE